MTTPTATTTQPAATMPGPSLDRAMISDRRTVTASGYPFFFGGLAAIGGAAYLAWLSLGHDRMGGLTVSGSMLALAVLVAVLGIAALSGLYTVQPNQSAVIVLFGRYVGTETVDGFRWTNPLASTRIVSRRTNSFETSVLKVNDGNGNPIEIAAAVMWRVSDAARAELQVESYAQFVKVQSEASVRAMANSHPYDHHDEPEDEAVGDGKPVTDAPVPKEVLEKVPSLLGGGNEIADSLKAELSERLKVAGVVIEEARITHLAYAPEIAPAMLRRQQAQAVVAAKRIIVKGAAGIVKETLDHLKQKSVPVDEDRQAALVSNLLVVLVADREAAPVLNTGSIY